MQLPLLKRPCHSNRIFFTQRNHACRMAESAHQISGDIRVSEVHLYTIANEDSLAFLKMYLATVESSRVAF